MSELPPKQQRFVEEYLVDLNGTQAAIRAGYAPKSAVVTASQLLTIPNVAEAVRNAQRERSERTQVTADNVVKELALIGFVDIGNYTAWGEDGVKLRESNLLDTRPVAEVKETVTQFGSNISFKLHDKVGALEKLGRHLGIFADKLDVNHTGGVVINLPQRKAAE